MFIVVAEDQEATICEELGEVMHAVYIHCEVEKIPHHELRIFLAEEISVDFEEYPSVKHLPATTP